MFSGVTDIFSGLVHVFTGDLQRRCRKGGAEQHGLPVLHGRNPAQDFADVGQKAHVEKAVGLIDDQKTDIAHAQRAFLLQVEQAARSADHDVHAPFQQRLLAVVAHAAVETAHFQIKMAAYELGLGLDLHGQLAGGRDDQRLAPGGGHGLLALKNGDQESGGLACAGLRLHGHVAARQGDAQCFFLDRGQFRKFHVGNAPQQLGAEL